MAPAVLSAVVSGRQITMTTGVALHCDNLEPERLVARRAGKTVSGDLIRVDSEEAGSCSFVGQISPPDDGRWFTYVEFNHDDEAVEAWLPVEAGRDGMVTLDGELYRPAGGGDSVSAAQVVYGGLIYLAGFALLAVGLSAARRPLA